MGNTLNSQVTISQFALVQVNTKKGPLITVALYRIVDA